jgi:hypothetical protein
MIGSMLGLLMTDENCHHLSSQWMRNSSAKRIRKISGPTGCPEVSDYPGLRACPRNRKSITFTIGLSSFGETRMLDGLRSRWMISFMHKGGRLQGMCLSFPPQAPGRQLAQLTIDERNQVFRRLFVSLARRIENESHIE